MPSIPCYVGIIYGEAMLKNVTVKRIEPCYTQFAVVYN